MLTFLFWNLKSANDRVLASMVHHHRVDVLILAESTMLPAAVLTTLNRVAADYFFTDCQCEKLQLYTRFSDEFVLPVGRGGEPITGADFTFRRLALPAPREEILLCAVHFPSKLRQQPIDQTAFSVGFADLLAEAEVAAGHSRTVLVGDLNMNPYDDGVVLTRGLHPVMTRRIAGKGTRRVKFESNQYFYNPMWSHFGEKKPGHAGTYYYSTPKARADFWNIYDQVLIRPALLPHFRDDEVEVLCQDEAAGVSLLGPEGIPVAAEVSDHLPVLFRLHV